MNSILNKLRIISVHCLQGRTLKSVRFPYRWKTTSVALPSQSIVINNLCEKLKCTEIVAKNIYDDCPTLRLIDAIQNDSLQMLRTKLSSLSIIENPELITMDLDTLERKIALLNKMKPKSLDDFAPLLKINEQDLKNIVYKRVLNEIHDVGKYENGIYYMSDKLQVEPKIISQRLVKCKNFFVIRFPIIKKNIDIALDYGVDRMDIVNCVYALFTNNDSFIRRSERMRSIALPIKMTYYAMPKERFDSLIEKHKDKYDKQKVAELTDALKKRNSDKCSIIKELKTLLECDDTESNELYYNHVNEIYELEWAETNIQYLLDISVSRNAIKKHGTLLTLPFAQIEENAKIVKEMMPKQIDDFIPLITVETSTLEAYKCILNKAKTNSIGSNHPIYYFSERLNIPADEVAANFAERCDVFLKYSPQLLKSKLDMLLKYDVDPASILRCKDTFLRSPQQIEKLVCRLKDGGVDKILSYMIADSYPQRIIAGHTVEKKSLEGFNNNIEYIAHRLNWNKDDVQKALNRNRELLNRSPSRIKEHLDYILKETGFNAVDIPKCLNIFSKRLDDLKARVDELSKIGAPITIPALTITKTEYLKYAKLFCNEENDEHKIILLAIEKRLKVSKKKFPIKKT